MSSFDVDLVRRSNAIEEQQEMDRHDDEVEYRLLVRLERDGLLRDGVTALEARAALDA